MKGCTVQANKSREYFVSVLEAAKVLQACPDYEWRLIFALCRFGGLRCPSATSRKQRFIKLRVLLVFVVSPV